MSKQIVLVTAVIILAVAGGSFYGGMKYAQSKNPSAADRAGFANLSPEERQARLQQFGQLGGGQRGARNGGGGGLITVGEIITKDDKSITVKLRDGGSKIVFFTVSTPVMKSTSGSPQDLAIGEQVTVTGTANQDGSLSAQSIQLRPPLPSTN